MTSIIISFSLIIGAIIILFYVLSAMGAPKEIAGQISPPIIALFSIIYKTLNSRKKLAKADTEQDLILSIEGYGLPMTRLILHGWVYMFAALSFGSALGGAICGILDIQIESARIPTAIIVALTTWPIVFLIGRWIGKRYIYHGVLTVVVTVLITRLSHSIVDIILVPKSEYKALFGMEKSIGIPLNCIVGTISLSTICLIGFWRGRHQRLTAYLDYLMKQVSPNARNAIVELAYDEAKKSSQEIGKSQA